MDKRLKILFLDDRSKRIHSAIERFKDCDLTIVTNVKECLRFLSDEDWDFVYLDHDLGGKEFIYPDDEESGMAVIHYLQQTDWPDFKPKPGFVIHSSNIFAATTMENWLQNMGFRVRRERWKYV